METQDVIYKNATFDIFGHSVVTIPHFSYPRPTVKRRSGFLFPQIDFNTNDGVSITTPYFYDISQDKNLTISPTIFSEHLPLIGMEYKDLTMVIIILIRILSQVKIIMAVLFKTNV